MMLKCYAINEYCSWINLAPKMDLIYLCLPTSNRAFQIPSKDSNLNFRQNWNQTFSYITDTQRSYQTLMHAQKTNGHVTGTFVPLMSVMKHPNGPHKHVISSIPPITLHTKTFNLHLRLNNISSPTDSKHHNDPSPYISTTSNNLSLTDHPLSINSLFFNNPVSVDALITSSCRLLDHTNLTFYTDGSCTHIGTKDV
ncbi:hypothetical protein RCL_jg21186.t1 [Rhizophagus clarus]|uniref:Uncharacterized protein n=1 Tax=Rhizophagus clarus TaxID=94130 RepID=A0A8H3LY74_9GLOM|nr:hypothetical protein RCL_jg21186.t1 [Rhizophagus clarus]